MSQVQIPNSDHCIWRARINHLCKSGLDPIDCKSSLRLSSAELLFRFLFAADRLKNTINLLIAINVITAYIELLKQFELSYTHYFFYTWTQTDAYCYSNVITISQNNCFCYVLLILEYPSVIDVSSTTCCGVITCYCQILLDCKRR